jgi:uncharacterized protein YndB with AHSA1/START domain
MIGTLREQDGRGVVHMEDTYATTAEDLWSALTEPSRLARWIAVVDGDIRPGGEFRASFTSGWDGRGRVDVCDAPNRLLVTTWSDDDAPTVMEAVLTPLADGIHLVIEERGLPLENIAAHGAGWQAHVEDLSAILSGAAASDWETRWTELRPEYEQKAEELA